MTVLGASPARRRRCPCDLNRWGTQRDPEGASRKPRRRHGHRRGVSLPTTPYQNAARMFQGGAPEGTDRSAQAP